MNKTIYDFLKQFLTAYDATCVPTGSKAPSYPYLTYSYQIGEFGQETSLTVNLWYRTNSVATPDAMAKNIYDTVGMGGVVINGIWFKRGQPFCQSMTDDSDPLIKRRYINLIVERLTEEL